MSDEINYEVYNDGGTGVNNPKSQIAQNARIYKLTTSFSHVLGNITSVIEQYIEDMMPKGYFKQKRVTTEVAFKDIKDFKKNLIAAEKPYLIIDPKIIMDQESQALPWAIWDRFIPHDHNAAPMLYMMNHDFFYQDEEHGFALGHTIARYKFQFNITIIVDTQMQRLYLENYLKSNFRFPHMYPIERYTETMIPSPYIEYIAEKFDMDITSEDFLSELNKRCPFTIVRLHRPATGSTEFFILQMRDIQIKLPEYPQGQRNMQSRVEMSSTVTFPMEIELNVMNNFLLISHDPIDTTELMSEYMTRISITSKAPTISTYMDKFSLLHKIAVQFDAGNETINLEQFLNADTIPVIKYILANDLIDNYVQVRVYKWTEVIDHTNPNIMSFDKQSYQLDLKGLDPDAVYTIAIYFDMNFIAKIKKYISATNTTGVDYEK